MVKRWLTVIGVIVALGLIAWGPEHSTRPHAKGRIPVIYWHMWSEKEWVDVVNRIVARFNASQDTYEVIPLAVPPDDAVTKFLLAESGGDPPDLVSQWKPILGLWSDRGLIQPVENQMSREERARFMKEAFPIIKEHAMYKGKIMAVVAGIDIHAIYYRLDDLKEVGRTAANLPQSLEDLTDVAHRLDRRAPDGSLKRIGFLPQNFEQLAPSFGETYPDGRLITMKCKSNEEAASYMYDQDKRLGFDNVTRFVSSQAADVGVDFPLLTGNYCMVLDGQWRVKQIADYARELNYAVAPIPPPTGGRKDASYTVSDLMLIPAASKHAKGAWEFMKFWIGFDNPDQGAVNVADMCWLPYSQKVADTPAYQTFLRKYPHFRAFLDMMPSTNLAIPPQGPMESYISDQIQQTDDALNRGSLTPAQALDQLQISINQERARQRRLGHG